MRFTSSFFAKVALAAMFGSGAIAAPWSSASKHSTHSVRELQSGVQLESYHPESDFQTFGTDGLDHALSKRADVSAGDKAKSFVAERLGVSADSVHFRSGYKSDVVEHTYLKQMHNGIQFHNAVANVALHPDGRVASFANSFVKPTKIASSTPTLTKEQAISAAEKAIGASYNGWETRLEYVVKADHSAVLAHAVQIQDDASSVWVEAFIDAHSGELVSMTDFVAKATYRVLPIQKEILTQGFETLANPEDSTSSPYGWLRTTSSGTDSTTTQGNNAFAYVGSTPASQSSSGQFVYTQVPSSGPTVAANKNAAIVNAFYIVNSVHDISYKYGFTEKAYNFQNTQIASGGKGNDRVKISVQDGSGTDNANFATPADGQSGQMRMFLWDYTSPGRDGALENDIITHENTHGISNRMTGGGTGSCLQTTEGGGMGEGWSDTMAFWTEQTSATVADYVMGQYVISDSAGIRSHPYSTSKTVNPYTYATVATKNEVHAIGEIWANTLVNVYAALVSAHGFDAGAKTSATGTGGNTIFLHLMLDGFALQPCNPTFLTARDAIIQADANRYAGANKCVLWNAFASRGLGVNAAGHKDNSAVPSGC